MVATPLVVAQAGCTASDGGVGVAREHDAGTAAGISDAVQTQHCFRNEHPFQDTMDIEELIVVLDGGGATGQYNWLPAFKDARLGRFTGSLHGNTISADYAYEQEGQSATIRISIILEDDRAIVEGGPVQLGLNRTLLRAACEDKASYLYALDRIVAAAR
ncbi:MAG: hypothetical protein WBN61_05120 [Woeseiaceae bacterium]